MSKPSSGAVALLLRSLATTVAAGVPINRALEMVGKGSREQIIGETCAQMKRRVLGGNRLSRAMAEHPKVFSRFQVGLVRVGENTGRLDEILGQLAHYEEKSRDLVLKFRSAMVYPLFISLVALLLMVFSPPLVLRFLLPILESNPNAVPLITKIYLAFCHFILNPGSWLLLGLLSYQARKQWRRAWAQPTKRYRIWRFFLNRTGAAGRFLRTFALARFARAFAVQAQVGTPPIQALLLAAEVTGDPVLIEDMAKAPMALRNGKTLLQSIRLTEYFPNSFLAYLSASEESGTFGDDFARLADVYDAELESSAQTFAALLEPLVMMGLGFSAGFLIFAVTMPMLQLMQEGF